LFDINHISGIEPLLSWSPDEMVSLLERNAGQRFALSVVTNAQSNGPEVIERRWQPGRISPTETPLGLQWPKDVYSLSHVALPFSPDDPVYGGQPSMPSPGVRLGNVAMRGERGVLQVSAAAMLRLRWNPFYSYQERRVLEFLALGGPAHGEAARSQ
jgi:hypothetical protein